MRFELTSLVWKTRARPLDQPRSKTQRALCSGPKTQVYDSPAPDSAGSKFTCWLFVSGLRPESLTSLLAPALRQGRA